MGELARSPLVIFTDLDGTLLDLETYSYLPALEALGRVISGGVPLVFCSSKTSSEQQHYQEQLGIRVS
jgi:predicted mannosyl-3-phosphoglycerate phosphatase (HAD superfamily)